MATTNIYLNFDGNCEEAFIFFKSALGGEFNYVGRFGEMPPSEHFQLDEQAKNRIMHISLPVGNSLLMGSDTGGEWAPALVKGNNFSVFVTADSKEEADRFFNALAEGGTVTMPMASTFWGDYFGTLTDQFGIHWMVSFNEQMMQNQN